MSSKFSTAILISVICFFYSCRHKNNIIPQNPAQDKATNSNDSTTISIPSIDTVQLLSGIGGVRQWTGYHYSAPFGGTTLINMVFEIIALPGGYIAARGDTIPLITIDTVSKLIHFSGSDGANYHYGVYYYYSVDSLTYYQYHHISAGGGTGRKVHTF